MQRSHTTATWTDPPAISPVWMQLVLSEGGDADGDGVPDFVEARRVASTRTVKDNDLFAATAQGARLFAMQQYRDFLGREGEEAGIQAGPGHQLGRA